MGGNRGVAGGIRMDRLHTTMRLAFVVVCTLSLAACATSLSDEQAVFGQMKKRRGILPRHHGEAPVRYFSSSRWIPS